MAPQDVVSVQAWGSAAMQVKHLSPHAAETQSKQPEAHQGSSQGSQSFCSVVCVRQVKVISQ